MGLRTAKKSFWCIGEINKEKRQKEEEEERQTDRERQREKERRKERMKTGFLVNDLFPISHSSDCNWVCHGQGVFLNCCIDFGVCRERKTDRQKDNKTERQKDKKTKRQKHKKTKRQKDKKTKRQKDRKIEERRRDNK